MSELKACRDCGKPLPDIPFFQGTTEPQPCADCLYKNIVLGLMEKGAVA